MVEGKNQGHYGLINTKLVKSIDFSQDDDEFAEGKQNLKFHLIRERNQLLISSAKKKFKKEHGKLYCEICGFNFFDKYGEIGEDFIEAHHINRYHKCKKTKKQILMILLWFVQIVIV